MQRLGLASVSAAALAAALFPARPAAAQSFTIPSETTVTTTQTMAGDDETGIVEDGGAIETVGEVGILSTGIRATITNSGAIGTSGDSVEGITSEGGDATIVNEGIIWTDGQFADGIESTGDNAAIINGGTIRTSRYGAGGISSSGDDADIINNGTIETEGDSTDGIYAGGHNVVVTNNGIIKASGRSAQSIVVYDDNTVVTNNGTIETSGQHGIGIVAFGNNATITNNGTIRNLGLDSDGLVGYHENAVVANNGTIRSWGDYSTGIVAYYGNALITNNGTIEVSGNDASGIRTDGDNTDITVGGSVRATGVDGYAITVYGSDSMLNLLHGVILEGDLRFSSSAAPTGTLNIGPGVSAALHFDTGSGVLPNTITAGGMPLVVDTANGVVYTADVTALRGQGQALGDLTGGIFATIDGRDDAHAAVAPLAYVDDPQAAVFDRRAPYARTVWLKGFGGYREENGSGLSVDQDQKLAGFVSGVDTFAWENGKAGFFLGGAWGRTEVDLSQEVEAFSAFGGAYGAFDLGSSKLDIALALGLSSYDSNRRVVDNSVDGGLANAEAEYDGFFVSPYVSLTTPFTAAGRTIETKVSARYAGLFLDGYQETGTEAALALDERDVHLIVGRASLSAPVVQAHAGGALTRFVPTVGLEGRVQFGDETATGMLAGAGISFDAGNGETLAAFASLRAEHETANGLIFFTEAEGMIEDSGSASLFATGGIRAKF